MTTPIPTHVQHYLFEQSYQFDAKSVDDLFANQSFLLSMLEYSMDGITVVTPEYDVAYLNQAMKQWYSIPRGDCIAKCYHCFHELDTVCENCPVAKSLVDKQPSRGTVPYMRQGVSIGFLDIYAVPVIDLESNVICVIEYTHNISLQLTMEKNLQMIQARFEIMQQQNEMLENRLSQTLDMFNELTGFVKQNVDKYVKPSLKHLKRTSPEEEVEVVSSMIDTILEPFDKQQKPNFSMLSSRELQIAMLIKEGKTSKEIAAALFITKKAVDYHRRNIRQKLNIDSKANLYSYLNEWF